MMETWLLIFFINGSFTRESYSISLEFNTKIECIENGNRISKDLTAIRNKENNWTRSILRTAKYSCNKVIRNE